MARVLRLERTPLMSQFTTNFTNPTYYGGSYKYGPVTNFRLCYEMARGKSGRAASG